MVLCFKGKNVRVQELSIWKYYLLLFLSIYREIFVFYLYNIGFCRVRGFGFQRECIYVKRYKQGFRDKRILIGYFKFVLFRDQQVSYNYDRVIYCDQLEEVGLLLYKGEGRSVCGIQVIYLGVFCNFIVQLLSKLVLRFWFEKEMFVGDLD